MEGNMITYFAAAAVVFFTLLLVRRCGKKINLPPGPFALPIIGHLHLLSDPAIHQTLRRFAAKYGPILHVRLGVRNMLVVSSPAAAEECLSKNDVTFCNRPSNSTSRKYLSYNSTTLNTAPYGPLWRDLRRLATVELFSAVRTARLGFIREEEVRTSVRGLLAPFANADWSHPIRVDVSAVLKDLVSNMLSQTLIGKRFSGKAKNVDEATSKHVRSLLEEAIDLIATVSMEDLLPALKWFGVNRYNKRYEKADKEFDKIMQDIVDKRRNNLRSKPSKKEDNYVLLDVLLGLQEQDPEYHTDAMIKGLMMLFFVGGTEGPMASLEWSLALLLNHPEVLKQLRDEIDAQVGHDHLVTDADLPKLQLLYRVLKESMRIYPFGPLLTPHEAYADCKVGGYDIPCGTILLVNSYAIQRDPTIWEDPMSFKPERFQGEVGGVGNVQSLTEGGRGYKFLPFGAGRRMCPAELLSYRLMALALGGLIQCFDWERVGEEAVDMTEGVGMSLFKATPLEAMYKPREIMMTTLSNI